MKKAWARFRGWPTWAQWVIGVVVALIVIGVLAPAEEDDEQPVSAGQTATTVAAADARDTRPASTVPAPTSPPVTDPGAKLKAAISKELGSGRKGVPRVGDVYVSDDIISVTWAINEGLTDGLTKDRARREAVQILETVKKQGLTYRRLNLIGSYALVDTLGNSSESNVVRAGYPKETVDAINFSGFNFKNAFVIAEVAIVHPTFQY